MVGGQKIRGGLTEREGKDGGNETKGGKRGGTLFYPRVHITYLCGGALFKNTPQFVVAITRVR